MGQQTVMSNSQLHRAHFPVPPGWSHNEPVDIENATLEVARYHYRTKGCLQAYLRWAYLALQVARVAKTIEEASYAFFNAPEGSIAARESFTLWDKLSLDRIEAATSPKELCALHRRIGIDLANGGEAQRKLLGKLDTFRRR